MRGKNMEYRYGERAILTREEMFDTLVKNSMSEITDEKARENEKYFNYLIEPIKEQMKQFFVDYRNAMAKENMTICDDFLLPRVVDLVSHTIFDEIEQELEMERKNLANV